MSYKDILQDKNRNFIQHHVDKNQILFEFFFLCRLPDNCEKRSLFAKPFSILRNTQIDFKLNWKPHMQILSILRLFLSYICFNICFEQISCLVVTEEFFNEKSKQRNGFYCIFINIISIPLKGRNKSHFLEKKLHDSLHTLTHFIAFFKDILFPYSCHLMFL